MCVKSAVKRMFFQAGRAFLYTAYLNSKQRSWLLHLWLFIHYRTGTFAVLESFMKQHPTSAVFKLAKLLSVQNC